MRSRFFWTILGVLVTVVVGTTMLHQFFLKEERLNLIDQQMRETASALLDSELNGLRNVDIGKVEALLSEELGESRIGKFFIIRNDKNEILFESNSARLLPLEDIPKSPQWISLEEKGQFIRVLNLKLPRIPDRTLQVGLVLDEDLYSPSYFSQSNMFFSGLILLVGLSVSWLLASNLVKPISRLSDFVGGLAENKEGSLELPAIPSHLRKYFENEKLSKDELSLLLTSFERLISRVNKGYQLSRFWSYQMAHELKTPLAIIESIVNDSVKAQKMDGTSAKDILTEVFEASETITSFLNWAEAENISTKNRMHVFKISRILNTLEKRFSHRYGERLQFKVENDFSVMANLEQTEQLLSNLIANACNYSPATRPVTIESTNHTLRITDHGPGIPAAVIERLGEPFNKGEGSLKGSGLGLAFAASISRLYSWELNIVQATAAGTIIEIKFPDVDRKDAMTETKI